LYSKRNPKYKNKIAVKENKRPIVCANLLGGPGVGIKEILKLGIKNLLTNIEVGENLGPQSTLTKKPKNKIITINFSNRKIEIIVNKKVNPATILAEFSFKISGKNPILNIFSPLQKKFIYYKR
jgi:hypothetical protein